MLCSKEYIVLILALRLPSAATAYLSSPHYPLLQHAGSSFAVDLTLPPLQRSRRMISKHHNRQRNNSLAPREIPVLYTNDATCVSNWLNDHVSSSNCIVGFDVELAQKTESKRPPAPAVVQLSTSQNSLVIHLNGPSNRYSLSLVEQVLRDPAIIKVGCGIDMDMVELCSISSTVEGRSRFDLGRAFAGRDTPGLKTLVDGILGLDLPKDVRVCRSDWSQFPLSTEQIAYAAYDAWAGAAIASRLAVVDPETFGCDVLQDSFHNQISIQELHSRRVVRKRAKAILTALLEPHKESGGLPRWKSRLVKELNAILKENKHQVDPPMAVKLHEVQKLTYTYRTNSAI